MPLRTVEDKVVVITGAGSGIGRELALRVARGGGLLALSDWDEAGLAETVQGVRDAGATVSSSVLDVSDRAAMQAWAADVVAEHGRVEMVVNNAGVTLTGAALDLGYDDIDWILGVNLGGVITGTKEFLPHLIASGNGALVNISSLFGLLSVPGQSLYNATKYAVRGFTEAVREEMLLERHPVTVTCVHPGGVRTGISRHGRKAPGVDAEAIDTRFEERLARTTAEKAAQVILDGALSGQARVLVGRDAHLLHHFARLSGARYQDVVAGVYRRMMP
ncbi:MAG: SDR family NAD(P)-dependent oxidoreductase [Nocardioides sp.]|nr:SDR family NAD(P)-dependent oxidoreductase [Nocardioides sp.]